MDCNTWEIAFSKKFVQLGGSKSALDEDDDLVKLQRVKKVVQLSVLLAFAELDVVLLQTVESKLSIIVHVNLKRVLHEFLADRSDLLRERGAEHHDLLLGWGGTEDILHISTHIYFYGLASFRIPVYHINVPIWSSILSHSSRQNTLMLLSRSFFSRTRALSRPGVATMICGWVSLLDRISKSFCIGVPP